MSIFTVTIDDGYDVTDVINVFTNHYMKDADALQIKIFLLFLSLTNAKSIPGIPKIARKFDCTDKDIHRSLAYWESHHLISFVYKVPYNLSGIKFTPSDNHSVTDKASIPKMNVSASSVNSSEPLSHKPDYSDEELLRFKSDKKQLLLSAEQYVGKPLRVSDIKRIMFISDYLHFSDDLILYLVEYCVNKGKPDFINIEATAVHWSDCGITSPKQADKRFFNYDKHTYTIMKSLGKSGNPTMAETNYVNRWFHDYGFTSDIIEEACRRTVMSTDSHRFEYTDGILSNWKKDNVQNLSDLQRIDELYRKRKQQESGNSSNKANSFNQFPQREYDFDDLEAKLLSK